MTKKKNPTDYEDEDAVAEYVDKIEREYGPKIQSMLKDICTEAVERGYECAGPADWSDENYRWAVSIFPQGKGIEQGVDVTIQIAESGVYGDDPGGVNFMLDIVGYGGEIVGGFAPFNFTADVWVPVDDSRAVTSRWRLFYDLVDPSEVIDQIDHFYERKSSNPCCGSCAVGSPCESSCSSEPLENPKDLTDFWANRRVSIVASTDGSGEWTSKKKRVRVNRLDVVCDSTTYCVLYVYFTRRSWDVDRDGYIYTDKQWLRDFREALVDLGVSKNAARQVDYTEQGMQGLNYVTLFVPPAAVRSLFPEEYEAWAGEAGWREHNPSNVRKLKSKLMR